MLSHNEFIAFGKVGPRGFAKKFIYIVFLWSPLLTLLTAWLTGMDLGLSVIVCIISASFSICGGQVFASLQRYLVYRHRGQLKESTFRDTFYSLPFAILGLLVGLEYAAPLFGISESFRASWESYKIGLLCIFVIMGGYTLVAFFMDTKHAYLNTKKLLKQQEAMTLQAQIRALTTQMSPHLLFNSLNTIAATMEDNVQLAEKMLIDFSNFFREILRVTQKDLHSLHDEIDICFKFLDIQKFKFEERLEYELIVDKKINLNEVLVPVLTLQALIENSIIHGIQPQINGGRIELKIEKEDDGFLITISDTGVGFEQSSPTKGNGTALKNTKERLDFFFGPSSHSIQISNNNPTGTIVKIKLPKELARYA